MKGLERAEANRPATTQSAPRPAAVASGVPLAKDDLWPMLAERAGREVLEEAVLDERLRRECSARGIVIGEADRDAEREKLLATMARRAGGSRADAEQTLLTIRSSRGLGPIRFAQLLERNAMLRRLAAPEASVTPEEVQRAIDMRTGVRYAARVIMAPSEREAAGLRAQLQTSAALSADFSRLAMQKSVDASAPSGGVLSPVSPADTAYPSELRSALRSLAPGEMSPVLAVDQGFAIVMLDEVLPPRPAPTQAERDEIEQDVRVNAERLAMEKLARRLVQEAGVTPMDASLRWSWETMR